MNAIKFVRKHGLQYTRNLVRDYPNHTHVTDDGRMFINENTCAEHIKVQLDELVKMDDLKRLVESYELVEECGGLAKAKERVSREEGLPNPNVFYVLVVSNAIADVEECNAKS